MVELKAEEVQQREYSSESSVGAVCGMHGRAESRGSTAAKAPQERSAACMAELKAEGKTVGFSSASHSYNFVRKASGL